MKKIIFTFALTLLQQHASANTYTQLLPRFAPPTYTSTQDQMRLTLDQNKELFHSCTGALNDPNAAADKSGQVTAQSGIILMNWQSTDADLKWNVEKSHFRGESVEACLLRQLKKLKNPQNNSKGSLLFKIDCDLKKIGQTYTENQFARTCRISWNT